MSKPVKSAPLCRAWPRVILVHSTRSSAGGAFFFAQMLADRLERVAFVENVIDDSTDP